MLLSGVDLVSARSVAERIRAAVAVPSQDRPHVTASVGVALRTQGESFETLVERLPTRPCTQRKPADGTRSASPADGAAALLPGELTMTTYEVTSERNGHQLIASWPDLPERAHHPVAVFNELKLATVAKSVLNAARRYRWHRWVQLQDHGIFTEERGVRIRPETRRRRSVHRALRGRPICRSGCRGCRRNRFWRCTDG